MEVSPIVQAIAESMGVICQAGRAFVHEEMAEFQTPCPQVADDLLRIHNEDIPVLYTEVPLCRDHFDIASVQLGTVPESECPYPHHTNPEMN